MCPDPLTQTVGSPVVTVTSYRSPALEGHTVNFSCSFSGEVVAGSNTSMCTREGEWEPDPKEISCDNDMMTTRKMIIPNSQHFPIVSILVGSLLGVILLLITVTTIIVAILVKGRIKGRQCITHYIYYYFKIN